MTHRNCQITLKKVKAFSLLSLIKRTILKVSLPKSWKLCLPMIARHLGKYSALLESIPIYETCRFSSRASINTYFKIVAKSCYFARYSSPSIEFFEFSFLTVACIKLVHETTRFSCSSDSLITRIL
jgi:hypothetical protein